MRINVIVSLILFMIIIPAVFRGDDAVVTLKDLEQEALRNNPEIHMTEKRVESAVKKRSLAAAMPDPMIGYEVQNVGRLSDSTVGQEEMSMRGVVVSQEIPFPGKLTTMGRAAGKVAEREQEDYRETKLRVLNSIRTAYYDYYLAYKSSSILERSKEIMKNFQRIAETRYATGQGIQQDVIRAQIEVSMLLEKIVLQEQKKEAQAAMINSILGRDPRSPLGRPGDVLPTSPDKTLDELSAMALARSPALLAKQRMVEQSEYELSSSKQGFLPDMVVSAGWFERGDFKDVWTASVMFKVPLYFWNKSAGVKAASAELGSARYDYESQKLMVLSKVKDLYTMAKTSERLLGLYETGIIPQARMALQSATSNYQVGKIDFLMLLDSQTLLFKYQLAYEQELVNLNKTTSQINEAAGMEEEYEKAK
ncbi:MAG TPA: TolC family protein [Nitrospirota bacterium]|nr:TolC family protein [Nitrospirota bacterium]